MQTAGTGRNSTNCIPARTGRVWLMTLLLLLLALNTMPDIHGQTVLKIMPHAPLQEKDRDPIWSGTYISRNHGFMVFDTLFALDENLRPQPQMVDAWSVSENKLSYFFNLRPDLRWHDGRQVTAKDCVMSLRRWAQRDAMGKILFERIDRLQALNDNSFILILKKPFSLVLESLAQISPRAPFMMPVELAAQNAFEPLPHIIGSGPFTLNETESQTLVLTVYERNNDYAPRPEPPSATAGGKIARADRIEWHYLPNPHQAIDALLAGDLDYYESPPPDLISALEQQDDIIVTPANSIGRQGFLRVNHLHPPFNNTQARQALLHLIDQKQLLQTALGDKQFYRECYSIYPCNKPLAKDSTMIGSTRRNQRYEYDLGMAKELIAQADLNNHRVIMLQPTDIPLLEIIGQLSAENLRLAGFDVEVQSMTWNTLLQRRSVKALPDQGGWNIFPSWWISSDILQPNLNPGLLAGGTDNAWFGWPEDARLNNLIDKYLSSTSLQQRNKLAIDIEKQAMQTVPHVVWGTFFLPVAYRKNLSGVLDSPLPVFWNIDKH